MSGEGLLCNDKTEMIRLAWNMSSWEYLYALFIPVHELGATPSNPSRADASVVLKLSQVMAAL